MSSRRRTGISAIARTPCGESVSAALANSRSSTYVTSTPRRRGGVEQGGAAGRAGELWGDEQAAHREGRAKELLDGANTLGDEESLALARPPSPEVAR